MEGLIREHACKTRKQLKLIWTLQVQHACRDYYIGRKLKMESSRKQVWFPESIYTCTRDFGLRAYSVETML
jgi:hypothetical protein